AETCADCAALVLAVETTRSELTAFAVPLAAAVPIDCSGPNALVAAAVLKFEIVPVSALAGCANCDTPAAVCEGETPSDTASRKASDTAALCTALAVPAEARAVPEDAAA